MTRYNPDVYRRCKIRQDEQCVGDMQQNAVSILRVSSKRQLEGESIPNQREQNRKYAAEKGYKIVREFEVAETASKAEKRHTYVEVLEWVIRQKGAVQAVIIWKVDRFSRGGVHDYYQLKAMLAKVGIRLESATERIDGTPSGEAMEGLLAVFARLENRVRVERTISSEVEMTKQGYWCRAAPTGYRNIRVDSPEGKRPGLAPTLDEKQWELLCYGLRKQLAGAVPATLVRELAKKGLKTKTGKPMSAQSWHKICRSPVYGGMNREKWTENRLINAKWDGAVTADEWHALQRVLDGEKKSKTPLRKRRHRLNADFPLRRFLRCPRCGTPARGSASRGKLGQLYGYYDCAKKSCGFRVTPKDAQKKFLRYVQKVKPTEELLALFNEIVMDVWMNTYQELNRENIELSKKVVALREEKKKIIDLMKSAIGSPALLESLQAEFDAADRQLKAITNERNEREIEEYDAEMVVNYCSYYMKHASELWLKSPVEDQDRLQTLIFPIGIHYDSLDNKRTPEISLVYKAMEEVASAPNKMAASGGIEPPLPG